MGISFLFSKYSIIALTFALFVQFTLFDFALSFSIIIIAISSPIILHAFIYQKTLQESFSIFYKLEFLKFVFFSIFLSIILYFFDYIGETTDYNFNFITAILSLFCIAFYQVILIYFSQFSTRKTFIKDHAAFKLVFTKTKTLIISSLIFLVLFLILPELIVLTLIIYFSFFIYFADSEYFNEE
jgi:hypothetical protein